MRAALSPPCEPFPFLPLPFRRDLLEEPLDRPPFLLVIEPLPSDVCVDAAERVCLRGLRGEDSVSPGDSIVSPISTASPELKMSEPIRREWASAWSGALGRQAGGDLDYLFKSGAVLIEGVTGVRGSGDPSYYIVYAVAQAMASPRGVRCSQLRTSQ